MCKPAKYTPNQFLNNSLNLPLFEKAMDREYFLWEATIENMWNYSEEKDKARKLWVRLEWPTTDLCSVKAQQKNLWETAEIDGELLNRAKGFQLFEERAEENEQPQEELGENQLKSEGESQIFRGDNLATVHLKAFNTEGKEAQFIQTTKLSKWWPETKKPPKWQWMKRNSISCWIYQRLLHSLPLMPNITVSKMIYEETEKLKAPEQYRPHFEKLSPNGS